MNSESKKIVFVGAVLLVAALAFPKLFPQQETGKEFVERNDTCIELGVRKFPSDLDSGKYKRHVVKCMMETAPAKPLKTVTVGDL